MVYTTLSVLIQHNTHLYRRPRGKDIAAPHARNSCTPLSIFLLHFAEIIKLLVMKTNCYYHCSVDTSDKGLSAVPDVTEVTLFVFLAITI